MKGALLFVIAAVRSFGALVNSGMLAAQRRFGLLSSNTISSDNRALERTPIDVALTSRRILGAGQRCR